ncbi:sensor histidine kinase [Isoalcanivorax beigongshangi]|uniref:histidine kinase n=1 Tax=Isoalcanivorax beigongshangi TaxID=3238810 RepID=A0ABV4AHS0_9GAMM
MVGRLKRYWRDHPLAIRLVTGILLASSLITLVAIGLLLAREYSAGVSHLERNLDQARLSSVPAITSALWQFDTGNLHTQIDVLRQLPEVDGVAVRWSDWSGKPQQIVSGTLSATTQNNELQQRYPLVYRRSDGRAINIGDLEIHLNRNSIYHDVARHAVFIALFQTLKTAVLALLILALVRHLLTRHLTTISNYARSLTLDRLHRPLALDRRHHHRDELDDIVHAINQMRATLQQDIREREATEQALTDAAIQQRTLEGQRERAEQESHARGELLTTISRELHTPLNAMSGYLELLENTQPSHEQQLYLSLLRQSNENLRALLSDVLEDPLTRRPPKLQAEALDLQQLVEGAVTACAGIAREQHMELVLDIRLHQFRRVQADARRIRQVLLNLLNNAFTFAAGTALVVRVWEDNDNRLVTVAVEDSGAGVEADLIDQVFAPFAQGRQPSQRYRGSGLGLTVCKRLVEAMGGSIAVDNRPQGGASFHFSLPMKALGELPARTYNGQAVLVLAAHPAQQEALCGMLAHQGLTPQREFAQLAQCQLVLVCEQSWARFTPEQRRKLRRSNCPVRLVAPMEYRQMPVPLLPQPVTRTALDEVLGALGLGGPLSLPASLEHPS